MCVLLKCIAVFSCVFVCVYMCVCVCYSYQVHIIVSVVLFLLNISRCFYLE